MHKRTSYSIASIAILLFLALTITVKTAFTHTPLTFGAWKFDLSIQNQALAAHSNGFLLWTLPKYTQVFGDTGGVITAIVIALALFFIFRQKIGAIWFAILAIVSLLLNNEIVKPLISRARPTLFRLPGFENQPDASYASGHSLFATILIASLLFIILPHISKLWLKILLWLVAFVLIFAVMYSRIFVGVHYPSDTIGGFLLGVAFIGFTYPSFLKFRVRNYKLKILQ
jgi:undecaprenyl-diphosphatase